MVKVLISSDILIMVIIYHSKVPGTTEYWLLTAGLTSRDLYDTVKL